ncbi:MAG: MYXO-CTERM sorting domain-containing protein [Nannocystaceae bacterium]
MTIRPALLAALASLALSGVAHADEGPPPENIVCGDKKVGDACEVDGAAGTCVADSCTRLDYSNGTPPETVSYECLRCQPGAAPKPEAQPAEKSAAEAPKPVETKSGCRIDGDDRGAPLGLALGLALVCVGRRRR